MPHASLLISPEFEGIKTKRKARCVLAMSLLISPEFEGIKTNHGVSPRMLQRY